MELQLTRRNVTPGSLKSHRNKWPYLTNTPSLQEMLPHQPGRAGPPALHSPTGRTVPSRGGAERHPLADTGSTTHPEGRAGKHIRAAGPVAVSELDFQFPLTILMILKVHLDPRRFLPLNKLRTSSLSQICTDNLISYDLISPN